MNDSFKSNEEDKRVEEPIPLADWLDLVGRVFSEKKATIGEISKLVWKRVRVKNREEGKTTWCMKESLLEDCGEGCRKSDPKLFDQINQMTKELRTWHKRDSYFAQGIMYAKNVNEFMEEYIFGKNPPDEEELKSFVESLGDQAKRDTFSSLIYDALSKKVDATMKRVGEVGNMLDKYIEIEKIYFMKEFVSNWAHGNNVVGTSIFSQSDIEKIKKMGDALEKTFRAYEETGKMFIRDFPSTDKAIERGIKSDNDDVKKSAHGLKSLFNSLKNAGGIKLKDFLRVVENLKEKITQK